MALFPACPRCGTELAADRAAGASLCPQGHGAFLEAASLPRLLGDAPRAALRKALATAGEGDADCPRCGVLMRAFTLRGRWKGDAEVEIEVDGCARCGGTWLDPGEDEALGRAIAPRPDPEPEAVQPRPPAPAAPRSGGLDLVLLVEALGHLLTALT